VKKQGYRLQLVGIIYRDQRGAVAILVAASIAVLFGFVGTVVDLGFWYGTRGALQAAADAGAMAAARTLPYASSQNTAFLQAVAQNAANQASSTLQAPPTVTVQVSGSGSGRTIKVTAMAPQQQFFSQIVGYVGGQIAASASASESGTISACVIGLASNNPDTIMLNDTASTINSPNCAVYSNGGLYNKNGTVTTQLVGAVGAVAGSFAASTEIIQAGAVVPDPYANLSAPIMPQTALAPVTVSGVTTYQPGLYSGDLTISKNSIDNFAPGVYYIENGNLNINGNATISGSGVTFYFGGSSPGTIQWNGNGNSVNLSAPSSGTYAGVLLYQSQQTVLGANTASISGNSTFNLAGAMYFPQTGIYFNGNSTTGPTTVQIQPGVGVNVVAQTVEVGGNATVDTGNPVSSGDSVGGSPYLSS
jgi:Flp pilus assembly protein TadG